MPYAKVNGIKLFYNSLGKDIENQAPIILIHGSTITGQIDWGKIAPRLAEKNKVYIPDCRGHGKSEGTHSYSFCEMADDTAEFIRKMGYERAHVIGHSNGGNVALVTLVEYPEVVQTAVLQAANAYVTPYLVEREPVVMDPEYYIQNNPDEVITMKAAHGPKHGDEYWRELLTKTMKEIVSEPNYTKEILARVDRPTFVIMGSDDKVNAPDRHAQFIAENIPGAELWIPAKTGHHVHLEHPDEWISKVLDFLHRRGRAGESARTLTSNENHIPHCPVWKINLR
jgi:pimeloyl-ACP methyl ester carboxylesterase